MDFSMITMIVVFVFAFSGSLLATPVARRLAIARGILDWPDGRRKRQRSPVPLLGGAAVFLGWLVAMVLARNLGASGVSSTGGMAVAGSLGFCVSWELATGFGKSGFVGSFWRKPWPRFR
jgi:UDP-N-acetylmuramyl pentapeptide phosphotransferase/UDP-N-acetylglucosamine-1-phosphate transferase